VPESTIKDLSDQLATLKGIFSFPVGFRLFNLPVSYHFASGLQLKKSSSPRSTKKLWMLNGKLPLS
jgi:hypothetical protein